MLLLVVVGVWGTAIYRYVAHFFSNDTLTSIPVGDASRAISLHEKDTFALADIQRDPFLGKTYPARGAATAGLRPSKSSNSPFTKKPRVTPVAPDIRYFGYIGTNETTTFLLELNGELQKIRKNEVKNGVKVLSFSKDSITIRYDGSSYRYAKNK
ncbi:hypothetical protein [Flavobacterium sp. N1718]|uniref:hypothetical protein n=1 Tax=Flavobacterium sp. N1718 TaxID=2986822 RepID=UPI002225A766|nr:hypothetical protein [Flavobacterium sp. N1718]